MTTVPAVVARRAAAAPEQVVLHDVHFEGREPVAQGTSYGDLARMAGRASARLAAVGVGAADRVLLAITRPSEFSAFFLGAQAIGAVPVPLPAHTEVPARAYRERIAAVARDAAPAAVVADRGAKDALPEEVGHRVPVIDAGECATSSASASFDPAASADDVAFLQYTSGSTGAPKGVVVRHRHVVANLDAIAAAGEVGASDSVYSWLPLFHDMGLMSLLFGLYLGIPVYLAPPRSFALRPDSWLRAVSRLQATISPGPAFAYDVVARRLPERAVIGIDLSSWRLAFIGAEPVNPSTARAFVDRFAAHGFRREALRPAYGMAECTLAAAFPYADALVAFDRVERAAMSELGVARPARAEDDEALTYTSLGRPLPGYDVRVGDPASGAALGERRVGEVVVRGPSVTAEYFGRPLGDGQAADEVRTGDLGYLAGGQLHVVGRIKEVVIVAGRKFIPADIEAAVGRVPGVRPGGVAAVAVDDRGLEGLGIVACAEAGQGNDDDLQAAVRAAVFEGFGVAPARVLVLRGQALPRTSSGKLQRFACLALFHANANFAGGFRPSRGPDAPRGVTPARADDDTDPGDGLSLSSRRV